jgi:hypothetical protein
MPAPSRSRSFIDKEYFTLEEVLEETALPQRDLIYLAENGHVALSVLVYDLYLGRMFEETEQPVEPLTGLVDLTMRDAHRVLKQGSVAPDLVVVPPDEPIEIMTGISPLRVTAGDLQVRKAERQKLLVLSKRQPAAAPTARFVHSTDYRLVELNGETFHLGEFQARIVQKLHEGLLSGSPWQNGKQLLSAAGSQSTRIHDLFKSQGARWARLVVSNGRGLYRLGGDD